MRAKEHQPNFYHSHTCLKQAYNTSQFLSKVDNYRIFFKINRKGLGPTVLPWQLNFSNYRLSFILYFMHAKSHLILASSD